MLNKVLDKIELNDIENLISNSVCENKQLEYKRDLNMNTNDEKKELLADITSFSNSIGGDLIFGLEEDNVKKLPTKILGIEYESEDTLKRRIEDLLRDTISPRITEISFKIIPLVKEQKKCIFIIRIKRSILAPHRIIFRGYDKFYTRSNSGKYSMSVEELRNAFTNNNLNEKIDNYNIERIGELISNRNYELIGDLPIFLIRFIPISIFDKNTYDSVIKIKKVLTEINATAFNDSFNKIITIDGVNINGVYNDAKESFAKYKVNGLIEKASNKFFEANYEHSNVFPQKMTNNIFSQTLVEGIIDTYNEAIEYYKKMNFSTSIIIFSAIINGKDYELPTQAPRLNKYKIDRDILVLQTITINELNLKAKEILLPLFDSIWNACGYEKCNYFDSDK